MADYLAAYVARHELPVRNSVRATRLTKDGDLFLVETPTGDIAASNVVVATGSYGDPKVPAFAGELDPHVVQMHSATYKNPSQLQPGGVLLVGGANSGADISLDVVDAHPTWLAGPTVSHIPPDIDKWFAADVRRSAGALRAAQRAVPAHAHRTQGRPEDAGQGDTADPGQAEVARRAGVQRVGRVVGVHDGLPQLEDGQVLDVTNVIWCTGYHHDFPWIDLPRFRRARLASARARCLEHSARAVLPRLGVPVRPGISLAVGGRPRRGVCREAAQQAPIAGT